MANRSSDISADDYHDLKKFIYDRCGIELGNDKQVLLATRLAKRLHDTQSATVRDYIKLLSNKQGGELMHFLDAITTNTTSFFREPAAFEIVDKHVRARLKSGSRTFRFWSAAASLGMEAYTLAMLLAENGAAQHDCAILATDISTKALAACQAGIYTDTAIAPVSPPLKARYFQRSGAEWQVTEALRSMLTVNRLNLSRPPYPMKGLFDAIYCRNVMIYFDIPMRQRIIDACIPLLQPGGLLLIGAAESLHGLKHSLQVVQPSAYRK